MAIVIEMPKLSDTMEEGGIAAWLKKVGEEVAEGEPLLEIETDKATMEYASPEEGVLLEILVKPGNTVALNSAIAILGAKGEKYNLQDLIGNKKATPDQTHHDDKKDVAHSVVDHQASKPSGGSKMKASPLARRMAQEKGIDLSQIKGSGPNGRIIAADLGGNKIQNSVISTPSKVALTTASASQVLSPIAHEQDVVISNSMMRKTIAKRLLAGKNEAPHFYLTVSANMGQTIKWRSDLNADSAVEKGQLPKVSINDLVMMAVGKALRKHPTVNSSWQGDSIIQFGGVHVCMAVALPTGLVTPVIRHIDKLGVRQIASIAKEYGAKAREGRLTNEDFQGGTFTVSNLGMTKVEEFTAIINPPQAAILAVGSIVSTPWVNAQGQIEVQQRMKMTLSSDHRVIDGMVGAKFLETLVGYLENPLMMLA